MSGFGVDAVALAPARGLVAHDDGGDASASLPLDGAAEAVYDAVAAAAAWSAATPGCRWEVTDDVGALEALGFEDGVVLVDGQLAHDASDGVAALVAAVRAHTGAALDRTRRRPPPPPVPLDWSRLDDPGHALADVLHSAAVRWRAGRCTASAELPPRTRIRPRLWLELLDADGDVLAAGPDLQQVPLPARPAALRVTVTPLTVHPVNGLAAVDGAPGRVVSQLGGAAVTAVSLRAEGAALHALVEGTCSAPFDVAAWSVTGVVPGLRSSQRSEVVLRGAWAAGAFTLRPALELPAPPQGTASWRLELHQPHAARTGVFELG